LSIGHDALAGEQLTLQRLEAWLRPGTDLAFGIDYAVPGNSGVCRGRQGVADLAGSAGHPRKFRDLAVSGYAAAWDARHHVINPLVGAERTPAASG
jgi:hypothetical protein